MSVFCDPIAPFLKMQTLNMFWLNLALPDIKQPSDVDYTYLLCSLTTFAMSKLEELQKLSGAWSQTRVVTFIYSFFSSFSHATAQNAAKNIRYINLKFTSR